MKILLDTNVILDFGLKREPHLQNAIKVIRQIDGHKQQRCITAYTVTDIYYIIKKEVSGQVAKDFILDLVNIFEILGVNSIVIRQALEQDFKDFEDAVQYSAAQLNDVDAIVTRNKKDFKNSVLKVLDPTEFIEFQKE
ncbi:MAG: PIN domain-containing protein [Cyclobacteriaceae bacterium]